MRSSVTLLGTDLLPVTAAGAGTSQAGARSATLTAAEDLYGASSTPNTTVAAAWSAVSVS